MTIVSYRLTCSDCGNEDVVREDEMDASGWMVESKYQHTGKCPVCNPTHDVDADSEYAEYNRDVAFENLDNIGDKGAENLREAGIVTYGDVMDASDEDILGVAWVGEGGLESIRTEVS